MMEGPLVNKVKESALVSLDMADWLNSNVVEFDLAPLLFQGLVLKEKDFRASVKAIDWSTYDAKNIAVFCSSDAIIPHWAYMLVAISAQENGLEAFEGNKATVQRQLLLNKIEALDTEVYKDQKIVVKGCGNDLIDAALYLAISKKLSPVVSSLMYGEPCSTVPLYKAKKNG